jgi:hypothetical protein
VYTDGVSVDKQELIKQAQALKAHIFGMHGGRDWVLFVGLLAACNRLCVCLLLGLRPSVSVGLDRHRSSNDCRGAM